MNTPSIFVVLRPWVTQKAAAVIGTDCERGVDVWAQCGTHVTVLGASVAESMDLESQHFDVLLCTQPVSSELCFKWAQNALTTSGVMVVGIEAADQAWVFEDQMRTGGWDVVTMAEFPWKGVSLAPVFDEGEPGEPSLVLDEALLESTPMPARYWVIANRRGTTQPELIATLRGRCMLIPDEREGDGRAEQESQRLARAEAERDRAAERALTAETDVAVMSRSVTELERALRQAHASIEAHGHAHQVTTEQLHAVQSERDDAVRKATQLQAALREQRLADSRSSALEPNAEHRNETGKREPEVTRLREELEQLSAQLAAERARAQAAIAERLELRRQLRHQDRLLTKERRRLARVGEEPSASLSDVEDVFADLAAEPEVTFGPSTPTSESPHREGPSEAYRVLDEEVELDTWIGGTSAPGYKRARKNGSDDV